MKAASALHLPDIVLTVFSVKLRTVLTSIMRARSRLTRRSERLERGRIGSAFLAPLELRAVKPNSGNVPRPGLRVAPFCLTGQLAPRRLLVFVSGDQRGAATNRGVSRGSEQHRQPVTDDINGTGAVHRGRWVPGELPQRPFGKRSEK